MPKGREDFSFSAYIKTLEADNIIIDKLRVGAYTARTDTLSNHGDTAKWHAPTGNTRRSKLFPRGARGFIRDIDIYCRDKGTAGGKVYVELWVAPYIGPIYTGEITVPAGGAAAWRTWSPQKFWNYDSLLIVCYTSSIDIELGYDDGGPDCFHSADAGKTWTGHDTDRFWFRADIQGMTTGDVPVSGILNTIRIPPSSSQDTRGAQLDVGTNTVVTLVDFIGAGFCDYLQFEVLAASGSENVLLRIYCDGNLCFEESGANLNAMGFTASTPQVSLLSYSAGGRIVILVSKLLEFKRRFEVKAATPGVGGPWTIEGISIVNVIT